MIPAEAVIPDNMTLSGAELSLLSEWLDRIADR